LFIKIDASGSIFTSLLKSTPGTVRLTVPPHVEAHGTVLHRVATLQAELLAKN